MARADVTFPSGSDQCAAWLYTPAVTDQVEAGAGTKRPIVVLAHGLAGVKELRLDAFAERFTAAGYVCLVFDYRHFGASTGEPRQLLDIGEQLEDWRAAVAYARSLDGIDPDRVVLWGTSFGGGHVIITAAEDTRIAAVIAQCPFTDGLASGTTTPPLSSLKIAVLALRDAIGAKLGRPPVMVASYGPPGSAALMSTPDSVAGIQALIPDGQEVRGDVAARFALGIIGHFPGKHARNVRCPIFFAICEHDSVAPAKTTRKWAAHAPHGEIRLYDAGHFDIYVGDDFERNVTDQLDFLARNVPVF